MVQSYEIEVQVPGATLIVAPNLGWEVTDGLSEEQHFIWDLRWVKSERINIERETGILGYTWENYRWEEAGRELWRDR